MQLNRSTAPTQPVARTHEGAVASRIPAQYELVRTVMACMLWEDGFYEDGVEVANRIQKLVHALPLEVSAAVAVEARTQMKLRHVPLLITREMARHPNRVDNPSIVGDTIAAVIQRADELAEFMAIYWAQGKVPLSKQVKLGLAKAFGKFNEYQLAKYNRQKDVKLRDVLFLCHSKPADVPTDARPFDHIARGALRDTGSKSQLARVSTQIRPEGYTPGELLYGRLIYDQLAQPGTWEERLSSGEDKAAVFRDLMSKNELGDMAFLRNLRNMIGFGITPDELAAYGDNRRWGRVLPFRFIAAARIMPQLEPMLERWMIKCLVGATPFEGKTAVLVDVSGSMNDRISARSDLNRLDAAKALAILLRELCADIDIYAFDTRTTVIPARHGFALGDAIGAPRGGTDIRQAVEFAQSHGAYKRIIMLTDEQSISTPPPPSRSQLAYLINIANNRHGVGYKQWLHIDGWSEAIVDYIQRYESQLAV